MNNIDFQYNASKPIDKAYIADYDENINHENTPVILEKLQSDGSIKIIEVPIPKYDHNPKYDTEQY